MKVYLVMNEWSTQDACDTVVEVFSTYEQAKLTKDEWVAEEKSECWDSAFDEDGNLVKGYCIEEDEDYFEMWEDGFYASNHTRITIQPKEVI